MNPNVPHMHMSGGLRQSSAHKENIQHAPAATHNLATNVNRTPPTNGRGK
jgi:hypothetical protein